MTNKEKRNESESMRVPYIIIALVVAYLLLIHLFPNYSGHKGYTEFPDHFDQEDYVSSKKVSDKRKGYCVDSDRAMNHLKNHEGTAHKLSYLNGSNEEETLFLIGEIRKLTKEIDRLSNLERKDLQIIDRIEEISIERKYLGLRYLIINPPKHFCKYYDERLEKVALIEGDLCPRDWTPNDCSFYFKDLF